MDQKQIIHIASEVVVISGLAIYFKMKTSSLSMQVEELKRRLITQEQLIEEFKNRMDEQSLMISKQDQMLTSLMIKQSFQAQMQPQPKQKNRSVPSKQNVGIVWDSESDYQPTTQKQQRLKRVHVEQPMERKPVERKPLEQPIERKPVDRKPLEQQVEKPVEEPSESEEDLDNELENELMELETQKQSDEESEIIEIDNSLKKKV